MSLKRQQKSEDKQQKSHDADHEQETMTEQKVKSQAPTTTWRFRKYLKSANHQTIQ